MIEAWDSICPHFAHFDTGEKRSSGMPPESQCCRDYNEVCKPLGYRAREVSNLPSPLHVLIPTSSQSCPALARRVTLCSPRHPRCRPLPPFLPLCRRSCSPDSPEVCKPPTKPLTCADANPFVSAARPSSTLLSHPCPRPPCLLPPAARPTPFPRRVVAHIP
ncbi:hypothetical protein BD309DRAFT_331062 [Dichomitus squalens]|nr:hypothetical protein BD309DRAFT_331062 [Dichomitus squalens]